MKIYHPSISEIVGLLMMISGTLIWVSGMLAFHFAKPGTFIESSDVGAANGT